MGEKETKTTEKFQKLSKIKAKFAVFMDYINPYKPTLYNENNEPVTPKTRVLYRKLSIWLIDVIINGLVIAFICWSFLIHKSYSTFNIWAIFTWGLAIFLVGKLLSKFWKEIISGLKEVAGGFRFK